jgi:hypothetical protein
MDFFPVQCSPSVCCTASSSLRMTVRESSNRM